MKAYKGRGAGSNRSSRFEAWRREPEADSPAAEDGIGNLHERAPATTVTHVNARSIISRNRSPDIPFNQSVNPYQGCEHGCVYCYARPTHAYLGLSPGLDFETRLYAKSNAGHLLRQTLSKKRYRPEVLALGANTDPYQPIERRLRITRNILEVALETRHPLIIITKSALVERDMDLLKPLAECGLVRIYFSVTTLNNRIARLLEPRAAAPARRLEAMASLSGQGIPTGVLVAPIIPVVTDAEIEHILTDAVNAGAEQASYVLLRLPLEVAGLFTEWLNLHFPAQAAHVLSLLRQMRAGRMNDARFGYRQRGEGVYADMIGQRFRLCCRRLRLANEIPELTTDLFQRPQATGSQLELFGY